MNKEALGIPAEVGPGAVGGNAGMHLLNKLRAQNESVDLNKSVLDAESEASDIVAEELIGKEAASIKPEAAKTVAEALRNALKGRWPNVTEAAGLAIKQQPKTILAGTAGAGLAGGALTESYLDTQRDKMKIIDQYSKRRQLLEGAPQFRDAEDLLGMAPEELNALLGRDTSADAIKQLSAPSEIDVTTQREDPVPMVEDPYEAILKSANILSGAKNIGKGYIDLLRGTKAKAVKEYVDPLKASIKASEGAPGVIGRNIDPSRLPEHKELLKKLKQELLKARLAQAGTIGATAAVPALVGTEIAHRRNVQDKTAKDQRVLYLRMKLASEKLKKNVSGDTVLKEKSGDMEIQDVAITKTKSEKEAWLNAGGGLKNLMAKSAGPEYAGGGYNPFNWLSRATDATLGKKQHERGMKQVQRGTYKPGMLASPKKSAKPVPKKGASTQSIASGIKSQRQMLRKELAN